MHHIYASFLNTTYTVRAAHEIISGIRSALGYCKCRITPLTLKRLKEFHMDIGHLIRPNTEVFTMGRDDYMYMKFRLCLTVDPFP